MLDGPFLSESEGDFTERFRSAFVSRWGEERAGVAAATINNYAHAAWSVGRLSFSSDEFPAFYLSGPEQGGERGSS